MSTLDEIARETGVSPRTVSNVLNGRNKETWPCAIKRADEIRAVAHRLGYLPNAAAVATATGRFDSVALLLSTNGYLSNLPPGLLAGIHDELAAHDLNLTLVRLPDEKLIASGVTPKILRQWMADGLLIDYNYHIPAELTRMIAEHRLPAVWINSQHPSDCVYPDDFAAGMRAAQYLLELGHTRIGYIDFSHRENDQEEHYSARDRKAGYEATLQAAGYPACFLGDFHIPDAERLALLKTHLIGPHRLTALIGYGGYEIQRVLLTALRLGLSVPEDLSLVTFDLPAHTVGEIEFTTLLVPEPEVGIAAVQMLRKKIAIAEQALPNQVIPFGFAPGATCARLNASS